MSRTRHIRAYARLGLSNVARVAAYRLALLGGWHPVQRLDSHSPLAPFFRAHQNSIAHPNDKICDKSLIWFGWHEEPMPEEPPNWFLNPFSEAQQPNRYLDWWRISDFNSGDIKGAWELSRFDWVIGWAQSAASGDQDALNRLNLWLDDWVQTNAPYKGLNWKCGQEASIRAMHLVTAAWILEQDGDPERGLLDMLRLHLQRIAPTMSYAIGQQNNHGTSEAAALFIGGSFLSDHDSRAKGWETKGRRWLEDRAAKLIEADGSFSQYSVNYHRLMLDTFSLAEAWRRHRKLPPFSKRLNSRLAAATKWLWTITDAKSGDAPNIGANDGARLIPLSNTDYRDFRPAVQLASAIFLEANAFEAGPWTAPLRWLRISESNKRIFQRSETFDDGGYHVLRTDDAMAVMTYPRYRFRPSQADALHVDLWKNGVNLLRDAGTFSYNDERSEWFAGTSAHNTIEFDDRNQMPRLSRFLFGDWLKANSVEPVRETNEVVSAAAGYRDYRKAHHHRVLALTSTSLLCTDQVSGNFQKACLRWRLAPGNWVVKNSILRSEHCEISIEIDGSAVTPILGHSEESRYYLKKSVIPVATVSVRNAATIVTKVIF